MGEQDNVLSIPPALEQPLSEKKKKRKKKKKHKKKKKRQIKKEEQLTKVLPMLDDSRDCIPWSELTECKLECHLCDKVYTQLNGGRLEYIEHLKQHYNDSRNDLTYLECEMCLTQPTKN